MKRNPRYSLRAFAQFLGMDSGAVSKILRGKRFMSESLGARVAEHLELDLEHREQFLTSLAEARVRAGLKRMSPVQKERLRLAPVARPKRDLSIDAFKAVADWYCYAILELTCVEGFQNDAAWIAKRLDLPKRLVEDALDRLKALELVEEVGGTLRKTHLHVHTADRSLTTIAHRRRQRQILEKSVHSLENHPIEIRNHSARTVAIDPEKIPEAKRRIEAFMLELCDELASGSPQRVYELSVQLFPLENLSPSEKENS